MRMRDPRRRGYALHAPQRRKSRIASGDSGDRPTLTPSSSRDRSPCLPYARGLRSSTLLGGTMQRRAVSVRGIVQGVGFRPFVHGLATRHGLTGFVRNEAGIVRLEVEGAERALDGFLADLRARAPALARIDEVRCEERPPLGETG